MPENIYSVHPDIVTQAIKLLAGAVVLLAGALVSTLLYIWSETKKKIGTMDLKIESIADSLSSLASHLTTEIAVIKTACLEKHHHIDCAIGKLLKKLEGP